MLKFIFLSCCQVQNLLYIRLDWRSLKNVCLHCLPKVSLGRSVGRHFFKNIYYLHMEGNGKKK